MSCKKKSRKNAQAAVDKKTELEYECTRCNRQKAEHFLSAIWILRDCKIAGFASQGDRNLFFLASGEKGECKDHLLGSPGVGCCTARHTTASSQMSLTSPLFGRNRSILCFSSNQLFKSVEEKRHVCYNIFSLYHQKSLFRDLSVFDH